MSEIDFNKFRPEIPTAKNFRNLTGQTFNRLTVVGIFYKTNSSDTIWLCKCICNTFTTLRGSPLRIGAIKSCGCLRNENSGAKHRFTSKSKKIYPPEHRSYASAQRRCRSISHPMYKHYGGRGIEFRFKTFEDFFAEVGSKPSPQHTIDRINNNGHYEKGNVKWASNFEQSRNRSDNHFITIDGVTMTMQDWATAKGISACAIITRLNKLKWCENCAVTLPRHSSCPHRK